MRLIRHLALIACTLGAMLVAGAPAAEEAPAPAAALGSFEGSADVGKVDLKGAAAFDPGTRQYRVTGSGENIWGTADAFHFAWRKAAGDFVMTADVQWVGEGKNKHRKAGWMVRQDLKADAPYADVMVHGDGLTSLQYRPAAGEATLEVKSPISAPATVQLARRGNVFTLSVAGKGEPLTVVGSATVALADPVYAGLAVSSHDAAVAETAVFSAVTFQAAPAATRQEENWPRFRGPTGLGYTVEANLPVSWGGPEGKNVLWKSPLMGEGHASPIVWGDAVFVATVCWPPSVTNREEAIPEHHLTCYQASDGKRLWDTLVPPGPWRRTDFRSGPGGGYAAATPVTDGKLIYCAFGSAVLAAVDFQGKIVWRNELVPYTFDVTVGSSPILYEDTVILFCAMAKPADSKVIAFDKATGKVKWQHPLVGMAFGHSTPVVIEVGGKPQMLVVASGAKESADALQSLNPATGERLWWCRGSGDVASPAFGGGLVYFDSGRGGPGFCVDPGGSGDVSATHMKWTVNMVPEGLGSPIIVGRHVYRLQSSGILKCWELATGKMVYSERLQGLSTGWASPIADPAGRIFFANGGKSYVVQAGPELRVLATSDLGDGNHPSPAVARGRLFLAGLKNLWCVGNTK